ncbi:sensor histidine kinase [Fundicoccus culcitae]|uniref:histidine kinase n=1 Tax=Fundicoccus culcitae TaxID=2969821 RepID=A0ABY5P328_9LACT|nr:HAMP domain-containing sensor histidine kinase [Fundicoccus culcitae]UUX33137.1 HAMP domain-containing histidine kinase [Fundicoccus culcitae]
MKQSLFWRIWFLTATAIIVSAMLFLVVFSLFANQFIYNSQLNAFTNSVEEIRLQVEDTDTLDETFINEVLFDYEQRGFSFMIINNDIYLKYPIPGIIVDASETESHLFYQINTNRGPLIQSLDKSTTLIENIPINNAELLVYYPISFGTSDMRSMFETILPLFAVISLIVATIVSLLYSLYFRKRIKGIQLMLEEMATLTYEPPQEAFEGDEIEQLKVNIIVMYERLRQTLEQLQNEIDVVKRFENDRLLFMRGSIHELKTPLMIMMTQSKNAIEASESDKELLTMLYSKMEAMNKLINEVLALSKVEDIKSLEPINITEVITEVLAEYEYMISDKMISLTKDDTPIYANLSLSAAKKIVSNLLSNAVKYVPNGGEIVIEHRDQTIVFRNTVQNNLQLDMNRILEPFVSFDNDDDSELSGSGLGLYIVATFLTHYNLTYDCYLEDNWFIFNIHL